MRIIVEDPDSVEPLNTILHDTVQKAPASNPLGMRGTILRHSKKRKSPPAACDFSLTFSTFPVTIS